jgi:hypothetical protein
LRIAAFEQYGYDELISVPVNSRLDQVTLLADTPSAGGLLEAGDAAG